MSQVPDQLVRLAAQDLHDAELYLRSFQRFANGTDPFLEQLIGKLSEHGKDLKATLPP